MGAMPSFIKPGFQGEVLLNKGKFLKLEAGKFINIVPLSGVEPPKGEVPGGKNCVINFQQYTLWLDDLPEGKYSPSFPNIGGKGEIGAILGLTPTFRAMMLVMVEGEEDEQIWGFGVQVFKQLVEIEQASGESIKGMVLKIGKTGEKKQTKYRVVPTTRRVPVEGEPETDLMEFIGPQTRPEIIKVLEEVDAWPPVGGDPLKSVPASAKKLGGPSENKGPVATEKNTRPARTEPVQDPVPDTTDDDTSAPWDTDEFEEADPDV